LRVQTTMQLMMAQLMQLRAEKARGGRGAAQ
jgi:hypothetical protein